MELHEYQEFHRVNGDKYAEFLAWLDAMIALGYRPDLFQAPTYTQQQLKATRRELRKVTI